MIFKCSIDLGTLLEKIDKLIFEIRSIWRLFARALYARAHPNATCKFDFLSIQIILKSLEVNDEFCKPQTLIFLFFFQLKTKTQIRGIIVFQQFKAIFFIKTLCLVLFICKTYLSMYWFKIRLMTRKIGSCRHFQFGFTFCTCITLRLADRLFFVGEWLGMTGNYM